MGQKFASYNASGAVVGFYDSIDSPVPSGVDDVPITDTEWQAALSSKYGPITVSNGALVIPSGPTLTQAQTARIGLLQQAQQKAEQAPLVFANAAGISSTFPMTPHGWTKYLGAYTKYIVHAQPLPSPFNFYDVNGKSVKMTVSDIENFFNLAERQIELAMRHLSLLTAQVEAANTVGEVQAIIL